MLDTWGAKGVASSLPPLPALELSAKPPILNPPPYWDQQGAVVKNHPANVGDARDTGLIPVLERSQ